MSKIEGGCLCGAVRYNSDADPAFMANCHCTDCQKSSAAGHMSLFGMPKAKVDMSGQLKEYQITADSGATVSHHFCPNCGSQIYNATSNNADAMMLVASSLDEPAIFSPQVSVYASSATDWDQPKEGIPSFDKMPPRG